MKSWQGCPFFLGKRGFLDSNVDPNYQQCRGRMVRSSKDCDEFNCSVRMLAETGTNAQLLKTMVTTPSQLLRQGIEMVCRRKLLHSLHRDAKKIVLFRILCVSRSPVTHQNFKSHSSKLGSEGVLVRTEFEFLKPYRRR